MSITGFITVRTSSSRLPSKCLMPFGDKSNVIEHIIRRAKHFGIDPIVCTSTDKTDDILEAISKKEGVGCFRGSLINKLKRWGDCCTHFNIEEFHSVDADDPFFCGEQIQESMKLLSQGYDMVSPTESSSAGGASVGYSLKSKIILEAAKGLNPEQDTEMMWYYVDKVPGLKKTVLPEIAKSPKMRLTLDYAEDYWLLLSVCRILGNNAARSEVDELFRRNPDLYKVNWFRNEEWKNLQLAKKA